MCERLSPWEKITIISVNSLQFLHGKYLMLEWNLNRIKPYCSSGDSLLHKNNVVRGNFFKTLTLLWNLTENFRKWSRSNLRKSS